MYLDGTLNQPNILISQYLNTPNQLNTPNMLEQFIKENRAAFDTENPPAGSWAVIEAQLPERGKRIRLRRVMRMAAAVVVLLGLGVLLGTYMARPSHDVANSLSDISGEYAEVEYFYSQQVKYNLKQL